MKRCLLRWKEGSKNYRTKFNRADLNRINSSLLRVNAEMPFEIHRAVRDLNSIHFWKGTEFRTFILYLGVVVLKDVLTVREYYKHFKLLFCSIIFCSSDHYSRIVQNSTLVDQLIADYFEEYIEIYGEQSITSNVHNLSHLLADVRRFGNLKSISTYPFENSLRIMKLKLRAMNKPLQQIARRMSEISLLMDHERENSIRSNDSEVQMKSPIRGDRKKFQQVVFKDYRLSSIQFANKWFMDKKERIIEFKYAVKVDSEILLCGYEVKNKENFFTDPISSSLLNIYSANILDEEQIDEIICKIGDIKCKMVCLSVDSQYVFQPLLHTLF